MNFGFVLVLLMCSIYHDSPPMAILTIIAWVFTGSKERRLERRIQELERCLDADKEGA